MPFMVNEFAPINICICIFYSLIEWKKKFLECYDHVNKTVDNKLDVYLLLQHLSTLVNTKDK